MAFVFRYFFIVVFLVSTSCSTFQSGRYFYVHGKSEINKIIKTYNVPISVLKSLNPKYKIGNKGWVFIPMHPGFLEKYDSITFGDLDLIWPVPSAKRISSEFGKRWGKKHEGIDIPAKTGSHIIAASEGVVVFSGNSLKTYGNMIILKHNNGFFTVYAHASKLDVTKGEKVSKGQVIARVGSTGRSTGPHLHFELRKNSDPIDPSKYLTKSF